MKSKKLAILMLGPPGSGKGTQGEILSDVTKYPKYVMSDMIKKELKKGTKLYDRIFKEGILLGDSDIFSIFNKHFKNEKKVIIDGIPRTLDQAYWLYGFLLRRDYTIKVVYINVDEKKLVDRITSRYLCTECRHMYNTIVKKPKVKGVCDFDGSKLIQREDDTKKVFAGRIKIFNKERDMILEVFKGQIIKINGDKTIEKVSSIIMKKVIGKK